MRLDGRAVRIEGRYPPYGTLWMLSAPGGEDERFEADVRYAGRFHNVPAAEVAQTLRAARRLPVLAPQSEVEKQEPPDRGGWVDAPPDADPVADIAKAQAVIEEEPPPFTGPEP
jgi:hypothetical protein